MQIFIVTVEEAQEHLRELIACVASGDQVVIADSGKSVATLGRAPMFPTTPEEVEATRPAREAIIRELLGVSADAPLPPPEDMTTEEYRAKYRRHE